MHRVAGPLRCALVAGLVLVTSACTLPGGTSASASASTPSEPTPSEPTPSEPTPSEPTPSEPRTPMPSAIPTSNPPFDLTRHSVDDPASLWVVVDKLRPLQPRDWVPRDLVEPDVPHTNVPQLREPAARALEALVAAAAKDGVQVVSLSAYRSYATQRAIFDRNLAALGRAATERLTARPGYSEHQTGLADDLGDGSGRCSIEACFATTPAGEWLARHAWRYGFIERYPQGLEAQTGIQWEPWHYRFVGRDLARHMRATDQPVLERVFGLPDSPDYP